MADGTEQGSNPFDSILSSIDKLTSMIPASSAAGNFLNVLKGVGSSAMNGSASNPFTSAQQTVQSMLGQPTVAPLPKPASYQKPEPTPADVVSQAHGDQPLVPTPVKTERILPPSVTDPSTSVAPDRASAIQTYDPFGTKTPDKSQDRITPGYRASQFTPQEQALYDRHLSNLNGDGGVDNADGSRSTLFAVTGKPSAKEIQDYRLSPAQAASTYIIPTVRDGKILPTDQAFKAALQEGIHNFPAYADENIANTRYKDLHAVMAEDTRKYLQAKEPKGQPMASPLSPNSMQYYPNSQDPDQQAMERKNQLQEIEGDMDANNGNIPPNSLMPNYGSDFESRWNNRAVKDQNVQLAPDPAAVHVVTQQVNRAGNMDVMRNIAGNPMLDQMRQEAITQLAGDLVPGQPQLKQITTMDALNTRNGWRWSEDGTIPPGHEGARATNSDGTDTNRIWIRPATTETPMSRADGKTRLAGDVVPLDNNPGPNAGPASASQIREGYKQGLPRTNTNGDFSRRIKGRLA